MAPVKKINNVSPDTNLNILVQTNMDRDDTMPSNLINGGWAIRNLNVEYEQTNESEYEKQVVNNELLVQYTGTKKFIITPDSFTYNETTYNTYLIGKIDNVSPNTNVKKIKLSNSVIEINDYAFENWNKLTEITISNSVIAINNHAFDSCDLKIVTLGNSIASMDSYAFTTQFNIREIYYNGTLENWCNIEFFEESSTPQRDDSKFYILDSTGNVEYNGNKYSLLENLVIPNTVVSIGDFQFLRFKQLKSLTIPNSVTSIEERAFRYCSNLTNIAIPNSVTSMGRSAFGECSKVESITISNNLTHIPDFCFYGCISLESVTIPNSVTNIGNSAFQSCLVLPSITIPGNVTEIGSSAFKSCNNLETFNFAGTKAQWNSITKGENWNNNCPFTVVHCSNGDVSV